MHISEAVLDAHGAIDQHKIDLVARAGGSYYSRARTGFFEISKPISSLGIGVDAIPADIRNSPIFNWKQLRNVGQCSTIAKQECC